MAASTSVIRTVCRDLAKRRMCSIQEKYLDERCIVVDEHDRPLRQISKRECHSSRTMTLHRAFSVFLFTNTGSLVLQKRSKSKITFPSVWTNSCCSHPLWTESELSTDDEAIGVRRAAQRKLKHELGIDSLPLERMNVMGRFIYKSMSDEEWGEHELDYAIVVPNFSPAVLQPNPEEVEETAVVSQSELRKMIDRKAKFSPWFSLFSRQRYLYTWWNNLDNIDKFKDLKPINKLN